MSGTNVAHAPTRLGGKQGRLRDLEIELIAQEHGVLNSTALCVPAGDSQVWPTRALCDVRYWHSVWCYAIPGTNRASTD
eukprot:197497-Rhodomonas_salina.1